MGLLQISFLILLLLPMVLEVSSEDLITQSPSSLLEEEKDPSSLLDTKLDVEAQPFAESFSVFEEVGNENIIVTTQVLESAVTSDSKLFDEPNLIVETPEAPSVDTAPTISETRITEKDTPIDYRKEEIKCDPNDPNCIPGLEEMNMIAFNIEFADAAVLKKLIEWSYKQVASEKSREGGRLFAVDLPELFHRALNPSDHNIDDEERVLLTSASKELRKIQGLEDDKTIIHEGFIGRGSPLRYLKDLAHKMHHNRRRLQERASEL